MDPLLVRAVLCHVVLMLLAYCSGGVLGLLGSKLIGRKAISNKMLESAQNLYLGEAIFEKTRGAALVGGFLF